MATGFEGKLQVTIVTTVKPEDEKLGDEVFAEHKKWLQATHGPWGLVHYTICKNKELKVPLDPTSEPTGRVIFTLNEIYNTGEGLQAHWTQAPKQLPETFQKFVKLLTDEGNSTVVMHGAPITQSLAPQDLKFTVDPEMLKKEA